MLLKNFFPIVDTYLSCEDIAQQSCAMVLGLPRVLEYSSTTRVVNYSSNFFTTRVLVNFYFRLQFPFPVAVFLHSQLTISFQSVQRVAPVGRKTSKSASELLKYRRLALRAMLQVTILTLTDQSTIPSSSLAACIKVLPVLTSKYSSRKVLVRGSPIFQACSRSV